MKFELNNSINIASIYYENNIVYNVNTEFLNLTGYTSQEFIGKSVEQLLILLRCNLKVDFRKDKNQCDCYIFTKDKEAKDINILQKKVNENNKNVLHIIEKKMNYSKAFYLHVIIMMKI